MGEETLCSLTKKRENKNFGEFQKTKQARASGTNDKAGSMQNLLRWVSPRTIKETFVTPEDYRYPFLGE